MGDFNYILCQEEIWGGIPLNRTRSSKLCASINYCKLIDLVFKGICYTWSNHRKRHHGLILERLDRCFTNDAWLQQHPQASVLHLPKTYSGHNPSLLILPNRIEDLPKDPSVQNPIGVLTLILLRLSIIVGREKNLWMQQSTSNITFSIGIEILSEIYFIKRKGSQLG